MSATFILKRNWLESPFISKPVYRGYINYCIWRCVNCQRGMEIEASTNIQLCYFLVYGH